MVLGTSSASSSHRRRVMANTSALTRYEADLTDRDRAKQKEAVRRYLTERVKTDWEWEWPRPEEGAPISRPASPSPDSSNDTTGNAYDMPGEYWKERDEWLSNTSEGEGAIPSADAGEDTTRQLHEKILFVSVPPNQLAVTSGDMRRSESAGARGDWLKKWHIMMVCAALSSAVTRGLVHDM